MLSIIQYMINVRTFLDYVHATTNGWINEKHPYKPSIFYVRAITYYPNYKTFQTCSYDSTYEDSFAPACMLVNPYQANQLATPENIVWNETVIIYTTTHTMLHV